MALNFKVTEVPEGLEDYYKETEDGYVLDVEGAVDQGSYETLKAEAEEKKSKLDEFRTHNIKLRKQIEQSSSAGSESDPPNIDELIEERVSDMKEKMSRIEAENNQYKSQLEEVVLSDRVKDIAIRHGVYETALPDVVQRARGVFTVKDGKPVPVDKKARDENGELYNPETWLTKLQEDAPHLFKPSSGSGAKSPVNGVSSADKPRSSTEKIAAGLNMRSKAAKDVM